MILAEFQTANYNFVVLGKTKAECLQALRKGWKVHALNTGADPQYLDDALDGVSYSSIKVGEVLRDGVPLK